MADLNNRLDEGLKASGLDQITFTGTHPCVLSLPEGGLELSDLGEFAENVLVSSLGYAGASDYLAPFFKAIPHLEGVILTRFEVDLGSSEDSDSADGSVDAGGTAGSEAASTAISGAPAFFIGFQLRETWEIFSNPNLSNIPVLAISNPGFTISSLGGPDAGCNVEVYGTLEIYDVAVKVTVEWPAMVITGSLVRPLNLPALLAHTGCDGLVTLDEQAAFEVRALQLRFDLTNQTFDFTFAIGGWPLIPGTLTLDNLLLDLSISREHKLAGLRAQFALCQVNIDLSGRFEDGKLELAGSTGSGQPIAIGRLIDELAGAFGDFDPPAALSGLTVQNLGVKYSTRSQNFTFTAEVQFPVEGQTIDMLLIIQVDRQEGEGAGSAATYQPTFSGRVTVDGLEFEVLFSKKGSAIFIATYSDPQGHPILVADLVDQALPGAGQNFGSLEFTIKDALLAYLSKPKPIEKKFLFSIDIDGGLDISDLNLPDLPLVGPPLPPDQALKLSFRLLAAKGTFTKEDVEALNDLITGTIKLPDNKIEAGLKLRTTLQIGQESKAIDLPVGSDQQPAAENGTAIVPAGEQRADSTSWFTIQKSIGPVHIERLGLAYKDQKITGAIDAALTAGGLTIGLNGFSFTSPFAPPFDQVRPEFSLNGLGIEYRSSQLEIGGAFARQEITTSQGETLTSFGGLAVIRTKKLAISAIGSYTSIGGEPSLFIYAIVDYPIGGPPIFYVTGLAAGFGYNRDLKVPAIDQIADFPLVKEATRKGGPPKLPASQSGQQKALVERLDSFNNYITPAAGQIFLAVGIHFTSFKIIDSFALLTVKLGDRLEFNLLGISTLIAPTPESTSPLAVAKLVLKATYLPDEGFFGAQAQLTADSYLFSKSCRLTGGFAFFSWFKSSADGKIREGDFVLTLGGYPLQFDAPSHYPVVPRLGINWQVTPNLTIKGSAYFALAPHIIMAGGYLEVMWHSGNLRAWFTANADFLLNWQPYHYDARIHVSVGASYTFHFFGSHTIGVHIGADLHLWGPEFSGTAELNCYLFSVRIAFGSGSSQLVEPIGWAAFKQSFLPADNQVCTIALQAGLVRQVELNGKTRWIINPKELSIVTSSAIPSQPAGANQLCIAPMGLEAIEVRSVHQVTIWRIDAGGVKKDVTAEFFREDVKKSVPAALWGAPQKDGAYLKLPELNPQDRLIDGLLAGYEFRVNPPNNGDKVTIDLRDDQDDPRAVSDAYQWEPPAASAVQGKQAWRAAAATITDEAVSRSREAIVEALGFAVSMLDVSAIAEQDLYCEVN